MQLVSYSKKKKSFVIKVAICSTLASVEDFIKKIHETSSELNLIINIRIVPNADFCSMSTLLKVISILTGKQKYCQFQCLNMCR